MILLLYLVNVEDNSTFAQIFIKNNFQYIIIKKNRQEISITFYFFLSIIFILKILYLSSNFTIENKESTSCIESIESQFGWTPHTRRIFRFVEQPLQQQTFQILDKSCWVLDCTPGFASSFIPDLATLTIHAFPNPINTPISCNKYL